MYVVSYRCLKSIKMTQFLNVYICINKIIFILFAEIYENYLYQNMIRHESFSREPFQKGPVSFCGFTRIRADQKWNITAMPGLELLNQHSPALTEFKNVFTALRLRNYFQNLQNHFPQKNPHDYAYSVIRKYIIINGSVVAGIEAFDARGKGLVCEITFW